MGRRRPGVLGYSGVSDPRRPGARLQTGRGFTSYDPLGFRQVTPYAATSVPTTRPGAPRRSVDVAGPPAQIPQLPPMPGYQTPEQRALLLAQSQQTFPGGPTRRLYTNADEAMMEGGLAGLGEYALQRAGRFADVGNQVVTTALLGPEAQAPQRYQALALGQAPGLLYDLPQVPDVAGTAAALGGGQLPPVQLPYGPFPGTGVLGTTQPAPTTQPALGPEPPPAGVGTTTQPAGAGAPPATQYQPPPNELPADLRPWWNAYQDEHQGRTAVQDYVWETGGNEGAALRMALEDRRWGEGFARDRGRPPTREEWENHWYDTRAYGRP